MAYRVREGLHWCECSGRIVFLDFLEDRYSCLPQGAGEAFLRVASGEIHAGGVGELRLLVEAGLLVDDPGAAAIAACAQIPAAIEDHVAEHGPSAAADLLAVIAAQLRWGLFLKLRPLAELVKNLERPSRVRGVSAGGADRLIRRLVSAFASASFVMPAADRCLVRALAFQAMCVRRGIRPQLVFGVRLNPFHAHCWVQLDRRVLIGDFEQVRLFTPIAVVG